MTAFLLDHRAIDAIVALVALEGLILLVLRLRTGRGPSIEGTITNLAAGACLLLALREALTSASAPVIGAFLALALAAHASDLAIRWRAASPSSPGPGKSASSSGTVTLESLRG